MAPRKPPRRHRGKIRVEWDREAIESLSHQEELVVPIDRLARSIAAVARQNAPVRTGAFRKSIKAERPRLDPEAGWSATVISTDPFAHLIEFGSVNNPPYRAITRAAQTVAKFVDARGPSVV